MFHTHNTSTYKLNISCTMAARLSTKQTQITKDILIDHTNISSDRKSNPRHEAQQSPGWIVNL